MKAKYYIYMQLLYVMCVLCLAATNSYAVGDGIEIGVLTLRPVFKLQEQFDSNVFLDENDEKTDFITYVDIGSEVDMRLGDVYCTGGYGFNMELFTEHTEQNSYNHLATGTIDWKLTDYEVIVKDDFKRFSNRAGSEDTSRTSRQNNLLTIDLLGDFAKVDFNLGYDFLIEDYLSDNFILGTTTYDSAEDRMGHTFRAEASHKFRPKTSLLAEVDAGWIDYENNFNSDSYFAQFLVGLRGEGLFESQVETKIGLRFQDYEREGDKDFAGVVVKSKITKNFGLDDVLILNIERAVKESTYLQVSYYYLAYYGFNYIHRFNNKWAGNVNGSFQINEYPWSTTEGVWYAKRRDRYYRGGCGLRYDIQKWLATELAYRYSQRASRFANFDYVNNTVTLSGTVQF